MSNIKRAISFYSLQDQYARGKMNLEDIFKLLKQLDAGMEFISDQMINSIPASNCFNNLNISSKFIFPLAY